MVKFTTCTPVGVSCPAVTHDQAWDDVADWGLPGFLILAIILAMALSGPMSVIDLKFKKMSRPGWLYPVISILVGVAILVQTLGSTAMVSHNFECCEAALQKDDRSWNAANAFFYGTWLFSVLFAFSILKTGSLVFQIINGVLLLGCLIGALVALGIIMNKLAFWTFLAYSVLVVIGGCVALYISRANRKKWVEIDSEVTTTMIEQAAMNKKKRERINDALKGVEGDDEEKGTSSIKGGYSQVSKGKPKGSGNGLFDD